jgi:hypothetical protein
MIRTLGCIDILITKIKEFLMADITTLIGGGVGVGLLGIILTSLKKSIDRKPNQELCEEKHKAIDKRLEKVDEIHETVIWMKAKMNGGGDE